MIEKRRYFFEGKVQNVGFRFHVLNSSKDFMVSGWVRNLLDGRVEMLVEGSTEQIDKFLEKCKSNLMFARIDNIVEDTDFENLPNIKKGKFVII